MSYSDPEQQRAFQREWYKKRRKKFLRGKKCIQCGTSKDLVAIKIQPDNSPRGNFWHRKDLKEYLKNRTTLCKKCQLDKLHAKQRLGHGTESYYKHRYCRCKLCKKAHSDVNKRYRAEKKLPLKERNKLKLYRLIQKKGYSNMFGLPPR